MKSVTPLLALVFLAMACSASTLVTLDAGEGNDAGPIFDGGGMDSFVFPDSAAGSDSGPVVVDAGPPRIVDGGVPQIDGGPPSADAGTGMDAAPRVDVGPLRDAGPRMDSGPVTCMPEGAYTATPSPGNPALCGVLPVTACIATQSADPRVYTVDCGGAMSDCTLAPDCTCTGSTVIMGIPVMVFIDFAMGLARFTAIGNDCDFTLSM